MMFSLLGFVAAASAACTTRMISVPVNTQIMNVTASPPQNDSQLVGMIEQTIQPNSNVTMTSLGAKMPLNQTYQINTKWCPAPGANSSTPVEFLIHGIGFDSEYWNFPLQPDMYSYVQAANANGYSTFSIDRLGTGNSSHPPSSQVQTQVHVEIVRYLTEALRNGTVSNSTHDSIVHVGHSYGSVISNALVAQYPNASQGLVLTGFSANATYLSYFFAGFNGRIASIAYPSRFGNGTNIPMSNSTSGTTTSVSKNLDKGYIISGDIGADEFLFFRPPYFNYSILEAAERTKQTLAMGESLTIAMGTQPAPQFRGTVQVVTGVYDLPFCGGNCMVPMENYTNIPEGVQMLFPAASNFSTYIVPEAAHALQLHYNAHNTTLRIHQDLAANGFMGASPSMSSSSSMPVSSMVSSIVTGNAMPTAMSATPTAISSVLGAMSSQMAMPSTLLTMASPSPSS